MQVYELLNHRENQTKNYQTNSDMSILLIYILRIIFIPLTLSQKGMYMKYFVVNAWNSTLYAVTVIQKSFILRLSSKKFFSE